jgi:hypothetical protein
MNYITALPYVIALALIAGVLRFTYVAGYNTSERKWNDRYTNDLGKANDALVKAKRDLLDAQQEQADIESELLIKQKEQAQHAQATIDSLRAGTTRLRNSLAVKACPSVPKSTSSTGHSDATSTGGLSEEDVRFLISEASRADQLAEQLTAAQQVIAHDRVVCP